MRVLVVDDSRAMRAILKNILTEFPFEIMEAGNGDEALDCLSKTKEIALILVDWNMPGMNGYDFLVAVRSNSKYDEIPIMMVTTETTMSQVTLALKAGANEYLMKPFTKEIFLDKLNLLGISYV